MPKANKVKTGLRPSANCEGQGRTKAEPKLIEVKEGGRSKPQRRSDHASNQSAESPIDARLDRRSMPAKNALVGFPIMRRRRNGKIRKPDTKAEPGKPNRAEDRNR